MPKAVHADPVGQGSQDEGGQRESRLLRRQLAAAASVLPDATRWPETRAETHVRDPL